MARRDLSNEEIEAMGKQEPGSASRYLKERCAEIEAEKQAEREKDDKERWIKQFVSAGGSPQDAQAAYKAHRNQQAQEAARAAEIAAAVGIRRRISEAL
jgi:hypothetical protein